MISNWIYNNKEINTILDMQKTEPKVWGFVYLISLYDINTKKLKFQYIGKKNVYSIRTKYLTQSEIQSSKKSDLKRKKTKNGFKYYKTIISESDWKNYISSNLFIKKNSKKFIIEREILLFSTNDSDLAYREAKEIMCQGCIDDPIFLNDSISIRRFGSKLIKG